MFRKQGKNAKFPVQLIIVNNPLNSITSSIDCLFKRKHNAIQIKKCVQTYERFRHIVHILFFFFFMNDGFVRRTFTITLIYEKNKTWMRTTAYRDAWHTHTQRMNNTSNVITTGGCLSAESQSFVDVVVFTRKTLWLHVFSISQNNNRKIGAMPNQHMCGEKKKRSHDLCIDAAIAKKNKLET